MSAVLVHYHELALKGKNRHIFENRLMTEIKRMLSSLGDFKVLKPVGRMIIEADTAQTLKIQKILTKIPGIANTQIVETYPADLAELCKVIPPLVPKGDGDFAIRARRDGKHYPFTSVDLGRDVGSAVNAATGRGVDLKNPDLEIFIEVAGGSAYVGIDDKVDAYRGLPVGVSGRGVSLLSGGFDSPVAHHLMQCRGMEMHAIHFHSAPMVSRASIDKVKELAEVLAQSQSRMKLCLIPIVEFQKHVVAHCPDPMRIVLYRRFMMRLANKFARDIKAKALVNGDSLGQVASQTIENMTVIADVAEHPILRPLVGLSKESILSIANHIGTEDISKLPHDDCCGFLMPQKPVIKARRQDVEDAEKDLDFDTLIKDTYATREILEYVNGKLKK